MFSLVSPAICDAHAVFRAVIHLCRRILNGKSNVIVTDKQIHKPFRQHSYGIFLHNWASLGIFLFLGPFPVKPWDGGDVGKIPGDQQFVKHSEQQPVWHRQPYSSCSKSLKFPFFPHSDAGFELGRAVFASSTRRNALGCCHVIGWLAVWLSKEVNLWSTKVSDGCAFLMLF